MTPLIEEAVDFALTNGLIKYTAQFKLTHAPFCLTPYQIEESLLKSLESATPVYNELMVKVGMDKEFIRESLEPVAETDGFIRQLLNLYSETDLSHHLQISRNDFLLSYDEPHNQLVPKQVEFNTISNSFVYLTHQTYLLHRYLKEKFQWAGNLVSNPALDRVVDAIARVLDYYAVPDACMLMVVQPREQNLFDQRGIEFLLWQKHGVKTIRKTLEEIAEHGRILEGHLRLEGQTAGLVYFRAGYTPDDYRSSAAWKGRTLIENSSAVTCPSVGMQLAGAKKIQQILARPDMLERYLSPEKASLLKPGFVGMYNLDEPVGSKQGRELAFDSPGDYVLKPQREGGGNNFYDDDMVSRIASLSNEEQKAYVLMERIKSPSEPSLLVVDRQAEETQTISEIGRYATCLFDGSAIRFNDDVGYLVRTKSSAQNEGGVCAGYACLNSLCCT